MTSRVGQYESDISSSSPPRSIRLEGHVGAVTYAALSKRGVDIVSAHVQPSLPCLRIDWRARSDHDQVAAAIRGQTLQRDPIPIPTRPMGGGGMRDQTRHGIESHIPHPAQSDNSIEDCRVT